MRKSSISTQFAPRYINALLDELGPEEFEELVGGLPKGFEKAINWLFEFWALPHQRPPDGDWATWVILGGRGAGKTRAGAEWVRTLVEGSTPADPGPYRRIALIGETIDQVREVMVRGESGILACSPPDRRPTWEAQRHALTWKNGAEAMAFSASNPESLRGPQFDAAWADELAKWPNARDTWDMLQFGLRLGDAPKVMVTTTPRRRELLKRLLDADDTAITRATTADNRANLSKNFLRKVEADYGGSRLGRQELMGEMLSDVEGALWPDDILESCRRRVEPELDRVVVAVDPPAGGGRSQDACGIVVAGVEAKGAPNTWKGWVLADRTVENASPDGWARAVVAAAGEFDADRVVAEVNQGGEMVQEILRSRAPALPYRAVRATRGKVVRAEPVSALYEQKRVFHLPSLGALEQQMSEMSSNGFQGTGSPDRVDALVWALTELMIGPSGHHGPPKVRSL